MELIIKLYIAFGFAFLILQIVRAGVISIRLQRYISKKHSAKAEEIGICPEGFYGGLKFFDYIFSGDNFDDDEIADEKKAQARSAIKHIIITMVAFPVGLMLLMLAAAVFAK